MWCKKAPRFCRGASMWSYRKPNSVHPPLLSLSLELRRIMTTIYLVPQLLAGSSGSPLDRLSPARGTTLHRGKDFAVALLHCCRTRPSKLVLTSEVGRPSLSLWTSLFAPLVVNLTGVTRYPSSFLVSSELRRASPSKTICEE